MLPLEVSVNGAPSGSWVLLERAGALYAPADAFEEWRVTLRPTAVPFEHQGQQWFALSAVPGFDAQLDFANQSVDLKFQPQAFAATRLGQPSAERPPLTPPTLGIFANYDLSYTRSAQRDLGSTQDLSALLELGASNALGVFTSTYAARNITSTDPLAPRTVRRLETTFTRDLPDNNLTLRLGDSSTRSGSWGRSVYFGGVQLSRNFGFTPGFIAQPLPVVTGLSSAPSTVELYINDALRQTSQVPTGPFAIDNFPLLTGNGQARIVVRDVLGRETVLVQDFFSHAELLEEGLSDWSVEAGAVRRDLGTSNADYGQVFGSGLLRYGLTKNLTLETRGELGRETQGAGVGLVQALPFSMLGQLATAVSRDNIFGRGQQWLAALQHSSLRHGFTLRGEGASRGYRQIGQEPNALAYRRQLSGSYTYSSERLGALGLGFARVASYDQGTLSTYSANYSVRVGERSSLSFNVVHVSGQPGGAASATSVGVSLLVPLEKQLTLSASASHRNGQSDGYVSANQGMSDVTGLSWRTPGGPAHRAELRRRRPLLPGHPGHGHGRRQRVVGAADRAPGRAGRAGGHRRRGLRLAAHPGQLRAGRGARLCERGRGLPGQRAGAHQQGRQGAGAAPLALPVQQHTAGPQRTAHQRRTRQHRAAGGAGQPHRRDRQIPGAQRPRRAGQNRVRRRRARARGRRDRTHRRQAGVLRRPPR
jgi:outer membrane usher protein